MKVTLLFKTPDVMDHPEDEQEELRESLEQWIQRSETLRVEFDTKAGTVRVFGAKE